MPEDDTAADAQAPDAPDHPAGERERRGLDVEALAERVYQLMVAEARLVRARGGALPEDSEE
jgi:hypothetical protein